MSQDDAMIEDTPNFDNATIKREAVTSRLAGLETHIASETETLNARDRHSTMPALHVERLCFSYGSIPILRDVTLSLPRGQVTCLMGRNGVGKTTLLKNLIGTLSPSAGSVRLGTDDITAVPPYRRAKLGLALVPQGREIFPGLTVAENLQIGLEGRRGNGGYEEVYDVFPDLKLLAGRLGGEPVRR